MDILSARKKAAERAKAGKKAGAGTKQDPGSSREMEQPPAPEPGGGIAGAVAPANVPEPPVHPAPGSSEQPAPAQEIEMLGFRLGNEEYALLVEQMREVVKLWEITSVPNAPEYVLGVTSLRGKVLPVIDLCKRLGLPPGVRDGKARIIVVSLDEEETGLIVDRVTGVIKFSPDDIRPAPDTIEQGAGAEFLRGLARKNDKLYILLDIEKAVGK